MATLGGRLSITIGKAGADSNRGLSRGHLERLAHAYGQARELNIKPVVTAGQIFLRVDRCKLETSAQARNP